MDAPEAAELARELRRLKERAGLSLAQLALRSWYSKSSLERYLNGKVFPPREAVEAICDSCGGAARVALRLWDKAWAARDRGQRRPGGDQVPSQLPPGIREFTGRSADLAKLDAALADLDRGDGQVAVVITALAGTAGVGKTALAAHWARAVAERFPDGQLWVNLRGFDPSRPMPPEQALTVFLTALGVAPGEVPLDLDTQVGVYRSLSANRRLLVVLDNARDSAQVRPLLPGGPGCLALVTSRNDLGGLVARDGATRIRLGPLTMPDSIALLGRLLGPVPRRDTAAVERLAGLCARLPLALRIAADRVDPQHATGVADLITALTGPSTLDTLDVGEDPHAAMRDVLSWSYQALPADAATMFRRLGQFPGPHWDDHAAAALGGHSPQEARSLLDTLTRAHLVETRPGNRFEMHDLLRAYAIERAAAEDAEAARNAALTRLLDHYLETAATAMDLAFPHEKDRRPAIPASGTPSPPLADADAARAWLDAERANLVSTFVQAADQGWPGHIVSLAGTMYRYLYNGAYNAEAVAIYTRARTAARAAGDLAAEATVLNALGGVDMLRGNSRDALDHFGKALANRRELGDRVGQAAALSNLGLVYQRWSRFDEAAEAFEEALRLARAVGNVREQARALAGLADAEAIAGRYTAALEHWQAAKQVRHEARDHPAEAAALGSIGDIYLRIGDYEAAHEHFERSLAMTQQIGARTGEAENLSNLGRLFVRWERHDEAVEKFEQALAVFREAGHRSGEAKALRGLGLAELGRHRYDEAVARFAAALELARELRQPATEIQALNGLGTAARARGRIDDAMTQHKSALALAEHVANRHEQAEALAGIGRTFRRMGDAAGARQHLAAALALFTELGVPEAEELRAELAQKDAR